MAAVEALLRRRNQCKNDGPVEEQPDYPRLEQIQYFEEHHCRLQAALWTHRTGVLSQSVFTLWSNFLRNFSRLRSRQTCFKLMLYAIPLPARPGGATVAGQSMCHIFLSGK